MPNAPPSSSPNKVPAGADRAGPAEIRWSRRLAGWLTGVVADSPVIDAYLLCGTPRTGSTLLCGLLRSTGVAGRPESYFRLPDEQAWADRWQLTRDAGGRFDYGDYVRSAVRDGSTPNGVFGGRVMWGTLDEMVAKLGPASPDGAGAGAGLALLERAFGRTRFVYLRRDDTVAQAVSWARAEQTSFWQDGDTALPGREPRYDHEQIGTLVRTIDEHNAAWREWFAGAGVQPHVVRYEELTADPAGVTRGILEFLDLELPAGMELVPGHRRQADQLNHDWGARYRGAPAG
jgi:LPS sulfotransferase NodH